MFNLLPNTNNVSFYTNKTYFIELASFITTDLPVEVVQTTNTSKTIFYNNDLLSFKIIFLLDSLFYLTQVILMSSLSVILMIVSIKHTSFFKKVSYFYNQEMGLGIDFFILLTLFLIAKVSFFLNIQGCFLPNSLVFLNLLLVCTLVVQTPLVFFYNVGSFLFAKIKGSSKKQNLVAIMAEDFVCIVTYNIRFFLQLIRWLLAVISLFLLHEYYYEMTIFSISSVNDNVIIGGLNLLLVSARALIEYLDLLFILLVQLTAFLLVLFWLLAFLFSTNLTNIFETAL